MSVSPCLLICFARSDFLNDPQFATRSITCLPRDLQQNADFRQLSNVHVAYVQDEDRST